MLGSILGSVASSVLGGGEGQNKAMQLIQALLQSQGGVEGLIAKFQQGGLDDIIKSWIGTGENEQISSQQVTEVLGEDNLAQAAQEAGVDTQEAGDLLSQFLPQIVDQLSPNGQLDLGNLDASSLLQQGAKAVLGKLFS